MQNCSLGKTFGGNEAGSSHARKGQVRDMPRLVLYKTPEESVFLFTCK